MAGQITGNGLRLSFDHEVACLQEAATSAWSRAVVHFDTRQQTRIEVCHLFQSWFYSILTYFGLASTAVLGRQECSFLAKEITHLTQEVHDVNTHYQKMKADYEAANGNGTWGQFLKSVGAHMPDPGQTTHFQNITDNEVRAGKKFIWEFCERYTYSHQTAAKVDHSQKNVLPQPPMPSQPRILPQAPHDAFLCTTTRVNGSMQETNVGGYDWKSQYLKKPHLQQYASQASCAIIAYRGTFSNYQQVPINEPVGVGVRLTSAEQLFHLHKFSALKQPDERAQILACPDPDSARNTAGDLTSIPFKNPAKGAAWGKANKKLMIYAQLVKALEPKTGLLKALIASGNSFIIEDTSSRRKEKTWGDAGDGTGDNWLGWAQMEARAFILARNGNLTLNDVQEYFYNIVWPDLDAYYQI